MGISRSATSAGLTSDDIKAANAIAGVKNDFEPFVLWLIEPVTLERMIAAGVVEMGPSCRPEVGPIGYRLSSQGWKLLHDSRTVRH